MQISIYTITGQEKDKMDLPEVFNTPLRPGVIKRAVLAEQTWKKQPKGVNPLAGKLVSVENWGPGRGAARVPRTKGSRTHSSSRGAFVPQARGGHKAHPPKSEKKIIEKINRKERRLAIQSAISYTGQKDHVINRGHNFEENVNFPIIVESKAEKIEKTKDAVRLLKNLGLYPDLERVKKGKNVRAGKGKLRGRKYKIPIGPLIIVGEENCPLIRAGRNILGTQVLPLKDITTELLAPGTHPGRLTVWTENAVNLLNEIYR